jgi:hypothetical protein
MHAALTSQEYEFCMGPGGIHLVLGASPSGSCRRGFEDSADLALLHHYDSADVGADQFGLQIP